MSHPPAPRRRGRFSPTQPPILAPTCAACLDLLSPRPSAPPPRRAARPRRRPRQVPGPLLRGLHPLVPEGRVCGRLRLGHRRPVRRPADLCPVPHHRGHPRPLGHARRPGLPRARAVSLAVGGAQRTVQGAAAWERLLTFWNNRAARPLRLRLRQNKQASGAAAADAPAPRVRRPLAIPQAAEQRRGRLW